MLFKHKVPPVPSCPGASAGWLGRFWADQSGNMSYLALAGSLVMMVFGGIGIDMMYAELKRTKIQNTLDRAVLAAADLDNLRDPETVVRDYFNAMNMSDALDTVETETSLVSRQVTATGSGTVPSEFMSLIGVDELAVGGLATAANVGANMEISLVLDISGSMQGQKIEQLKTAAKSFVDTVLGEGGDNSSVTISIVPYNATVNLGPTMAPHFAVDAQHDLSYCARFDAVDFTTTAVTPVQSLEQLSHFNIQNSSTRDLTEAWCTNTVVVPHSNDPDVLKAHIDSFTAGGNTAIDLGVKWGMALLDPAAAPAVQAMSAAGEAAATASDRPAAFHDDRTMKFVVVMTDGQNTSQFDLRPNLKTGLSDVWLVENDPARQDDDQYSIRVVDRAGSSNDLYYWPAANRYRNAPQGAGSGEHRTPRRLTHAELFERVNIPYYANQWIWPLYRHGYASYNDYYNAWYSYQTIAGPDAADSRLSNVCASGRDRGVVVFAIGVEAPQRGLDAMGDCASSPAHFFDVDGDALDATFASIATTITKLRLTQ